MKVVVADRAGVCYGVRRALEIVESELRKGRKLATLGPLIHNPQAVKRLEERGVKVVQDIAELDDGAIVMPSHGVPKAIREAAERAGLQVVDATCPFVAKVHRVVRRLAEHGYEVVVIGDPGHSEVKGILSAAGENAVVVSSVQDVEGLDWTAKKVGIVCQTTQTPEHFGEIVGRIAARAAEVVAHNTICYATHDRQSAARSIAPKVDAMFVVGGRNSANTNRLAEICRECGVRTYHIETADEIDPEALRGCTVVGLTAGASTPDWVIEEVKSRLEAL
ncbi:MAG: 4-hydroxy-3-methylbut-2-enyl diphosphate reductase [Armatimonadota bacterium]|nr:4-hydroxy-3-methylbut-2-enyl diphosphate reductase [Armatimonadota bacterium]